MIKIYNFKFECVEEYSELSNMNDFLEVVYKT